MHVNVCTYNMFIHCERNLIVNGVGASLWKMVHQQQPLHTSILLGLIFPPLQFHIL